MRISHQAELNSADPSKDAKKTARAITGGEPNSDWSTDFDARDYIREDVDGDVIPNMEFKPTLESTMETLTSVIEGPSFASADALIEYVCGVQSREGGLQADARRLGVLWYMANQYRAAAGAVERIARIVTAGADTAGGQRLDR